MNNIYKEIDKYFDELKKKEIYKNYKEAKNKLNNNKEINGIINEIIRLQKICANNNDDFLEMKIKDLYSRLDNYPLYQSYLAYKEELENELIIIKNVFDNYFHDILELV